MTKFLRFTIFFILLVGKIIFSQWSTDPNNTLIVGYGLDPHICSDSAGGCYITYNYETTFYPQKLAVERLDRYGYKPWGALKQIHGELPEQWQAEIIEDGEGGVIVSYEDNEWIQPYDITTRVRVQKVDSTGNLLWGQTGIRVSLSETNQGAQKIISDRNGGCIIVWADTLNEKRINRINRIGERLWGDSGKVIERISGGYPLHLSKIYNNQFAFCYGRIIYGYNLESEVKYRDSVQYRIENITSDKLGGVVVSWYGGSINNIQIVAQRKDSIGNNLWQEPYVVAAESLYINSPISIEYNDGNYYYSWAGNKNGIAKVAQFQALSADGNKLFPDGSIQIGNPPLNGTIVQPLEINRTAFIYYNSDYLPDSLLVQSYDTLGNKLWNEDGIVVSQPPIEYQSYATDSNGGFILGGVKDNFTVVAQQVNKYGQLGNVIVPVELISFNAEVANNKITLNWITATETNNWGFEIQRQIVNHKSSIDNQWKKIGFAEGNGTTSEAHSYSFIDNNVTERIYKYQLKQIDYDGSFKYSNEIEVNVNSSLKEYILFQNYPNPFNSTTIIKYQIPEEGRVRIYLYNIIGEKIKTLFEGERNKGEYTLVVSSDELSSGAYFYSLETNSSRTVKKLTVLK